MPDSGSQLRRTRREQHALRRLGDRVTERRGDEGLTQQEVGDRAGVSIRAFQSIEWGKVNPSYLVLLRVARAIGVSLQDLID